MFSETRKIGCICDRVRSGSRRIRATAKRWCSQEERGHPGCDLTWPWHCQCETTGLCNFSCNSDAQMRVQLKPFSEYSSKHSFLTEWWCLYDKVVFVGWLGHRGVCFIDCSDWLFVGRPGYHGYDGATDEAKEDRNHRWDNCVRLCTTALLSPYKYCIKYFGVPQFLDMHL